MHWLAAGGQVGLLLMQRLEPIGGMLLGVVCRLLGRGRGGRRGVGGQRLLGWLLGGEHLACGHALPPLLNGVHVEHSLLSPEAQDLLKHTDGLHARLELLRWLSAAECC